MRVTRRLFPDVAQLGIGTGVIINQSRISFSGARGLVMIMWSLQVNNGGAVAINQVSIGVNTNAILGGAANPQGWFDAVAARELSLNQWAFALDPAVGAFGEIVTLLSGGTVDIPANAGVVTAVSFEIREESGPVVTIT